MITHSKASCMCVTVCVCETLLKCYYIWLVFIHTLTLSHSTHPMHLHPFTSCVCLLFALLTAGAFESNLTCTVCMYVCKRFQFQIVFLPFHIFTSPFIVGISKLYLFAFSFPFNNCSLLAGRYYYLAFHCICICKSSHPYLLNSFPFGNFLFCDFSFQFFFFLFSSTSSVFLHVHFHFEFSFCLLNWMHWSIYFNYFKYYYCLNPKAGYLPEA